MVGGETEQDGGLAGGEGACGQDMRKVWLSFGVRWALSAVLCSDLPLFSTSLRICICAMYGKDASSCRLCFLSF